MGWRTNITGHDLPGKLTATFVPLNSSINPTREDPGPSTVRLQPILVDGEQVATRGAWNGAFFVMSLQDLIARTAQNSNILCSFEDISQKEDDCVFEVLLNPTVSPFYSRVEAEVEYPRKIDIYCRWNTKGHKTMNTKSHYSLVELLLSPSFSLQISTIAKNTASKFFARLSTIYPLYFNPKWSKCFRDAASFHGTISKSCQAMLSPGNSKSDSIGLATAILYRHLELRYLLPVGRTDPLVLALFQYEYQTFRVSKAQKATGEQREIDWLEDYSSERGEEKEDMLGEWEHPYSETKGDYMPQEVVHS